MEGLEIINDKKKRQISGKLTKCLRHNAVKQGLSIDENGWVEVAELLKIYSSLSMEMLLYIVDSCRKKRFSMRQEGDIWFIRCNQGHSIPHVRINMEEITIQQLDPLVQNIIHGTYKDLWDQYIKHDGLSKMERNNIHFVDDPDKFIGSSRSNVEILIYIDFKKAIEDGFKFFLSDNGVILSPGDDEGFMPPKYFSKVVDMKTGHNVLVNNNTNN